MTDSPDNNNSDTQSTRAPTPRGNAERIAILKALARNADPQTDSRKITVSGPYTHKHVLQAMFPAVHLSKETTADYWCRLTYHTLPLSTLRLLVGRQEEHAACKTRISCC